MVYGGGELTMVYGGGQLTMVYGGGAADNSKCWGGGGGS